MFGGYRQPEVLEAFARIVQIPVAKLKSFGPPPDSADPEY